jgi:hypothetical protein
MSFSHKILIVDLLNVVANLKHTKQHASDV